MTYNIHQLQNGDDGDDGDDVFGVEKIENGRFDRSV